MALADFLKQLDDLESARGAAFDAAADAAALEAARVEFLGAKQGRLKAVQKGLGGVDTADRPAAGKRFNEVKTRIEAAFQAAAERRAAGGPAGGSGRAAVRSHLARHAAAAGPAAPHHADDRGAEGHHGPARLHGRRRARRSRTSGTTSRR